MKQDRLAEFLKQNNRSDAKFKPVQGVVDDRGKIVKLMNEHLKPCGDDLILLTLTGHLIIEAILDMILLRQLDIEHLPPLEFSHKLGIVKAIVIAREPKPNADLLCAIGKLNSIRNDLAHKLMRPPEIENAVKSIIQSYQSKADLKLSSNEKLSTQLRSCIAKLCTFLHSVIIHLYKLERQKIELLTGEE